MRKIRFHAGLRETLRKAARAAMAAFCAAAVLIPAAPAAIAAEDDNGPKLDITIQSEEITEDSGHYKGPVSLVLSPEGTADSTSVWVEENGIWKMLTTSEDNTYRVTVSKDGEYQIQFRAEDKETLAYTLQEASFSVSAALWDAMQKVDALPDPEGAGDDEVTAVKRQIADLSNTLNTMRQPQREIAQAQLDKLASLRERLVTLDPGTDYEAPEAPEASLTGEADAEEKVYASVDIDIQTGGGEVSAVLMNRGDGWMPVEKNGAAKYVVSLNDPGEYHIDLCTEDAAGNRSVSTGVDVVVDPDIPAMIDEIDRLYKNAQSLPQSEYISGLEKMYLQYMGLSPSRQALVPGLSVSHLMSMYSYILEQIKFENVADIDGRFAEAIGMYRSLNVPALYLSTDPTSFIAQRLDTPGEKPDGLSGEALAEYRFAFQCPEMQEEDLPLSEGNPIRIGLQVPDDLIGKKNIEMYYVGDDGKAVPLGARVRSTQDGLVMYFNITGTGRFLFVSGSAAPT